MSIFNFETDGVFYILDNNHTMVRERNSSVLYTNMERKEALDAMVTNHHWILDVEEGFRRVDLMVEYVDLDVLCTIKQVRVRTRDVEHP